MGLQTWIVGPFRNVFQNLATRKFESWDEVLDAVKRGEAEYDYEVADLNTDAR